MLVTTCEASGHMRRHKIARNWDANWRMLIEEMTAGPVVANIRVSFAKSASPCSADGLWAPFCCLWRPRARHNNASSIQFRNSLPMHPSLTLWMGTVSLGMVSRQRIYTSQLWADSKDRTSAMRKPCICSVVRGLCLTRIWCIVRLWISQ